MWEYHTYILTQKYFFISVIGNPGNWESWREWGSCSHSCGKGLRSRSRGCTGLFTLREIGPPDCGNGDYTELDFCNSAECSASKNIKNIDKKLGFINDKTICFS